MSEGQVIFQVFLLSFKYPSCTFYISGSVAVEPEAGLSHEQLASEVKQLTRERDHLLVQARRDSESLERKEIVIKAQYEEQLEESANKVSQVKKVSKDIHEDISIANFCKKMRPIYLNQSTEQRDLTVYALGHHSSFLTFHSETVASWLVRSTPGRALRVRSLAGDIVLCS